MKPKAITSLLLTLLFAVTLSKANESVVVRMGADFACQGLGGELLLKQGSWYYGLEYTTCGATSRISLRTGYQPFIFLPLEVGTYLGALGGFTSYGLVVSGWVPLLDTLPNQGQLNLAGLFGVGFTHLPVGGPLPGLRLAMGLEYRQPIPSLPSTGRGNRAENIPQGSNVSQDQSPECTPPTPESLMATFKQLAESTRSAVMASIGLLYTDISVELSDFDVSVEGQKGYIRARYVVSAIERSSGRRLTYSGLGEAHFRHNGCSWQLVSYRY